MHLRVSLRARSRGRSVGPMRGATTAGIIAALIVAAALAAGCGGDDDGDKQPTSTAAAPLRPTTSPTATDLRIVRLVQETGARLHLNAIRLFGDRVVLEDKGALSRVAAARLKIATKLEREAAGASAKLESLAKKAVAASEVATAGEKAFEEFGSCGHEAAAFFRKAGAANAPALSRPDAACKSARLAYGQATTVADALRAPEGTRTTGAGAPS
jgi:hypothetical protein